MNAIIDRNVYVKEVNQLHLQLHVIKNVYKNYQYWYQKIY